MSRLVRGGQEGLGIKAHALQLDITPKVSSSADRKRGAGLRTGVSCLTPDLYESVFASPLTERVWVSYSREAEVGIGSDTRSVRGWLVAVLGAA